MRTIQWRIITENQTSADQADELRKLINENILELEFQKQEEYYKFENSYSLDFVTKLGDLSFEEGVIILLDIATSIVDNWMINYHREFEHAMLIFNKNQHSKFAMNEFASIMWISADLN